MELFTTQGQIDRVAKTWKRQYWSKAEGWSKVYSDKEVIYKQLLALVNPTADDVADVIGNRSWTRLTCDECRREVDAVVRVGNEPDYDSSTAYICLECLQKALALIVPVKEAT